MAHSYLTTTISAGSGIEASWAGGLNGREVIDKFLPMIPVSILTSPCNALMNGLYPRYRNFLLIPHTRLSLLIYLDRY